MEDIIRLQTSNMWKDISQINNNSFTLFSIKESLCSLEQFYEVNFHLPIIKMLIYEAKGDKIAKNIVIKLGINLM